MASAVASLTVFLLHVIALSLVMVPTYMSERIPALVLELVVIDSPPKR